MLTKEVLINTGWTSAESEQTRMLLNRPAICDSTCPVLVGTIHSTISSILSCVSSRRISACFWRLCGYFYGAAGCWVRKEGLDELKNGIAVLKICIMCHLTAACFVEPAATTPKTRWCCSQTRAGFWRLCDHFYGAASCWAGKGGLYEL
jgi:hypothetical protein